MYIKIAEVHKERCRLEEKVEEVVENVNKPFTNVHRNHRHRKQVGDSGSTPALVSHDGAHSMNT